MAGRYFAIGDVHGCFNLLESLWDEIEPDFDREKDTLVFIGDYIDRGPDSREVVDFVLDLKKKVNTVCLRGNHEQMLLNYHIDNACKDFYLMNGGTKTIMSYGMKKADEGRRIDIPQDHMDFFRGLITCHETERYIFVHAGLKPGVPLHKQDPTDMIWIRNEFIDSDYDFGKTIVFGHTPLPKPLRSVGRIGIDTGAVYGGKLTCVQLPEEIFYQV
jgi:serine/threonine protein phosphatase 1